MAGPPPLVTQQEVFDTADQILENGVRPSAKKIRLLLGKSSFTTIHKHLLVWRKGFVAQNRAVELVASGHD